MIIGKWYESGFMRVIRGDSWLKYGSKKMAFVAEGHWQN
jgi:hypothetical protein